MALATQAEGASVITENIFENRFMHAQEMLRMGANIKIEGRRAMVRGKTPLSGAAVFWLLICGLQLPWCWLRWWRMARRLSTAFITSIAGMKILKRS